MISNLLLVAVKLSPLREYQIARLADVHPSTLSKLLNGIERPRVNDPRVIRVGEVLGLSPEHCFEPAHVETEPDKTGEV